MNEKVSTLIVDDHKMFLDGLFELLKDNDSVQITATANNGEDAINILKNNKNIKLVISDISMPLIDGVELTKRIKKLQSGIRIIILSMHKETDVIHKLIQNEVDGYLLKNADISELDKAINKVLSGEKYFTKTIMNEYMESIFSPSKLTKSAIKLSKREKDIIKLIANEYTNQKIAEKLFLSLYTVETHRKNILRKINAKNTAGIVKYAIQHNLI